MYGTILSIDRVRRFGFIRKKEFENNLFFHCRNVSVPFDSLLKNQVVEFEVSRSYDRKRNRKSFIAVNVKPVQKQKEDTVYNPFNDPSSDLFNCDGC